MLRCHGQCFQAQAPRQTLRRAPLLRAAASSVTSSSRPTWPALRQQHTGQHSTQQEPTSWAPHLEAAAALLPALALAAALPPAALADVEDALDELVDASTDAAAAPPQDIFVTIMFGSVVALLTVVTLGVRKHNEPCIVSKEACFIGCACPAQAMEITGPC